MPYNSRICIDRNMFVLVLQVHPRFSRWSSAAGWSIMFLRMAHSSDGSAPNPPSPPLSPPQAPRLPDSLAALDRSGRPDPGSRKAAAWAWLTLVVAFVLVALIQALGARGPDGPDALPEPVPLVEPAPGVEPADEQPLEPDPQAALPPTAPTGPTPPEPMFEMVVKITLATATTLQEVGSAEELEKLADELKGFARSDEDRVRVAIVLAELGREVDAERKIAMRQLNALLDKPDLPAPIAQDARDLISLYAGEDLADEARQRLLDRYEFYAEVALAHDRAPGETTPALAGLSGVLFAVGALTIGGGVLLVIGCVLLAVALLFLLVGRRKARFVAPARGGSVYLEAVAVFVLGFLLLKLVLVGVALLPIGATGQTLIALGLQCLLLAATLWPLLRGETFSDWSLATGWHRGSGVLKEIGIGVLGWVAAIPIFVVGGAASAGLVALWQLYKSFTQPAGEADAARPLPDAAVFDTIASGNIALTIALFLLATVWAPLAEESIFRGCFYRHLRSFMGAILAGLVSASVFGFMHGYGVLFLPPVIALGFCFALMREWRGSLIAPVTAHLLHNATLVSFMIVITRLMG